MKIANPIFDPVFKYLMEDKPAAIHILSVILGVTIVDLEVNPQEYTKKIKGKLRIFRIDFKATVKLKNGKLKTIIIEIQKARKEGGSGYLRFRRYIASAYGKTSNLNFLLNLEEKNDEIRQKATKKTGEKALPVVAIYFLGFELSKIETPFLHVKRVYTDGLTGKSLETQHDNFVEQLSHDLYVIQIPRLHMLLNDSHSHHNSELAQVLDVFNQDYQTPNKTILEYPAQPQQKPLSPQMQRIFDRLSAALYDEDLYDVIIEEEIEAAEDARREREMERIRRKNELLMQKAEKLKTTEKKLKEVELKIKEAEKQKQEVEKQKQEAEKQKQEAEKQKQEAEKQKQEAEKQKQEAVDFLMAQLKLRDENLNN